MSTRFTSVSVFVGLTLVAAAGVEAKPPSSAATSPAVAELSKVLDAIVASAQPVPAKASSTPDHDQGDEHASPKAILKVCTKDTPAAQNSAICQNESGSPN